MTSLKLLIFFILVGLSIPCFSVEETPEERRARWDLGPKTIDVSAYPAQIQANYEIFATRCKKCHNPSRPINSDYALPDEWERYIKRMMHKPGSEISGDDGKKIFEFLVYDASIRKADLVSEKMKTLSPEEKKAQEDKIAQIKSKYGG